MSSISNLWSSHHRRRHDWAHAASEAFQASLSPDVRQHMLHKRAQDEAYIVVFGSTQVGKTTLLLDLMGLSEESAAHVAEVLRGGREKGRSSTPTAMEYRRSPDDRWILRESGEPAYFNSAIEMTAALGNLRARMESGCLRQDKPVEVFIPISCFNPTADHPFVRMLDLPGGGAHGQAEQRHVEEMARRYVGLADLILLVGKSDRLDFLRADALTLPGIEDWQLAPSRFRIITTYSFTPQSIRDQVRLRDGRLDAAFFRQRLIEQIGKAVPLLEHSCRQELFFPLEFGHSWRGLQKRDPDFHAAASRIISDLKQELLSDIKAAATPLARIKNAVLAHEVVARVKDARARQVEGQLTTLQRRKVELEADLRSSSRILKSAQHAIMSLRSLLAKLSPAQIEADLSAYGLTAVLDDDPTPSVRSMREEIAKAKGALLHSAKSDRPGAAGKEGDPTSADRVDNAERQRFWQRLPLPPVDASDRRIVDLHFYSLVKKLDSYVLEKYVRTGQSSNYEQDKRALHRSFSAARSALNRHRRARWLAQANASIERLQEQLKHQDGLSSSIHLAIDDLRSRIESIDAQHRKVKEKDREKRAQLARDLEESRRFRQALDESYLARSRKLRAEVYSDRPGPLRLISLLAAIDMAHAREELSRITEDLH